MLNPSKADAERDDPTIRRCIGIARSMGCEGVHVVNLFAVRATRPRDMKAAGDPVGPENFEYVRQAIEYTNEVPSLMRGPVICAWGTQGGHMGQDETVMDWIAPCQPYCLEITKHGFPKHPLYVRRNVILRPYVGRSSTPHADPPLTGTKIRAAVGKPVEYVLSGMSTLEQTERHKPRGALRGHAPPKPVRPSVAWFFQKQGDEARHAGLVSESAWLIAA